MDVTVGGGVLWWRLGVAVGGLLCLLLLVLPSEGVAARVLYPAAAAGCIVAAATGIRRLDRKRRKGWYVFLAGMSVNVIGDVIYTVDQFQHVMIYPSWADVFYLASYPLYTTGVLLLTRHGGRHERGALLDATIMATGVGFVLWVFGIVPLLSGSSPPLNRFVNLSYPLGDVMMLTVIARMLTARASWTPAMRLLASGTAVMVVADVAYSLMTVDSQFTSSNAPWLVGYVLWAAAATHRSPRVRRSGAAGTGTVTRSRLAQLCLCTLLAPAVVLWQGSWHVPISWLSASVVAIALFLMVTARMSILVEQVQTQKRQLEEIALRDDLTGLANRRHFQQCLEEAVPSGRTQVAILDLCGFKGVNDRLGHAAGDSLLQQVAKRLAAAVREGDVVARTGGDEFAILLRDADDPDGDVVATRLGDVVNVPFTVDGRDVLVGMSAGIAGNAETLSAIEIVRRADIAMYSAKRAGERLRRYEPDLDHGMEQEAELRPAGPGR